MKTQPFCMAIFTTLTSILSQYAAHASPTTDANNTLADANIDHLTQQQLRNQSQRLVEQQQQQIIAASEAKTSDDADQQQQADAESVQSVDTETAIFISINQRNWQQLKQIVAQYQQQDDANADLILFAHAALNSAEDNISTAISQYQQLLAHQPNFLRARLELARLYYQDQLLAQAEAEFLQLKQIPDIPAKVLTNIDAYLTAIDNQQRSNGTIALNIAYDDNIKDTSTSDVRHCFFYAPNGKCLTSASSGDKPIKDSSIGYQLSLNRDWQLHGHHGITANALSYATVYRHRQNNDNNSATFNISAGYRYADHDTKISITPFFEYQREDQQKLNDAKGIRLNVRQALAKSWGNKMFSQASKPVWSFELEKTRYQYTDDYRANDGDQISAFSSLALTNSHNNQWILFADYLKRDNQFAANAYRQKGIGIANVHQWNHGIQTTLIARQHRRKHQGYNALLQAQREDKQYTLSANMRFAKLNWHGFEPSIGYQYRKNDSNIDWLYDFDSSEINFKLQKVF